MPTMIPDPIEKCKGAMLAAAIGDALGWPNEPRSKNRIKTSKVHDFFVEWTRRCKEPRWHDERILPGEYSDDTQMTLSVARSIIAGDWERFFAEKELPFWLRYERGGGGALLKAARSISDKNVLLWQSSYTKNYFNAGGNGAAMRILPHVIAGANTPDLASLMHDVIKNTLITHGHPRAFLGATCYAYALDYLLRKNTVLEYGELVTTVIEGQQIWGAFPEPDVFGQWLEIANHYAGFDYSKEWDKVLSKMLFQLKYIKASLEKGLMLDDTKILADLECFSKVSGAGDVAALAAIYLTSRYATNPTLGIKVPAFSFNADTDTIASITGGLLGMLCGTNWIPAEWKAVQDYDCIVQMAELLLADDKKAAAKAEVSNMKAQENAWKPSPIGKIRFIDSREYPNAQYGVVLATKWQTALGQTIYIKEFRPFEAHSCQYRGQMRVAVQSQTSVIESKPEQTAAKSAAVVESKRKSADVQSHGRQFMMNASIIEDLLDNPEFKRNVTVGKVFKVIKEFVENDESVADVAKRFDLDEGMVEILKECVK